MKIWSLGITLVVLLTFLVCAHTAGVVAEVRETQREILQTQARETITQAAVQEDVQEKEIYSDYLGRFTISHYCAENYPHICNDGDATHTASGAVATVGRTVAVDPDVIPFGTMLLINGQIYIAEDSGGAIKGKRIDILVPTHDEALERGVYETDVYVITLE